jgi:hypothetical protein
MFGCGAVADIVIAVAQAQSCWEDAMLLIDDSLDPPPPPSFTLPRKLEPLFVLQPTKVTPNKAINHPPKIPIEAIPLLIPAPILFYYGPVPDDAAGLHRAGCTATDEPRNDGDGAKELGRKGGLRGEGFRYGSQHQFAGAGNEFQGCVVSGGGGVGGEEVGLRAGAEG